MSHAHAHNHSGYSHAISAETNTRMLAVALAINVGFMALEITTGILANSLALLSNAAHMLTDAGAIALAIVAARLARREVGGPMTFGLRRGEIVSAQVNGLVMALLAAFIIYEGISRLISPPDVEASLVLWIGLSGLAANAAAGLGAGQGQPPEPQRRRGLPAQPDGRLRLARRRPGGLRDSDLGL
jgi:cobalt-zinc-cadmium efflux system protein